MVLVGEEKHPLKISGIEVCALMWPPCGVAMVVLSAALEGNYKSVEKRQFSYLLPPQTFVLAKESMTSFCDIRCTICLLHEYMLRFPFEGPDVPATPYL